MVFEQNSVDPDRHVRQLSGDRTLRLQAAALPWRCLGGRFEVMLITSRDSGRWVLPKGWPEPGEALCDAAAREAHEEAGLKGAVARHAVGRYLYAKAMRGGGSVPCDVSVFPLEVRRVADKWKECRQRARRWMGGDEAAAAVRETELAALIVAFCAAAGREAA